MQSVSSAAPSSGVAFVQPGGTSAANNPSIRMAEGTPSFHGSSQVALVQPSKAPRAKDAQILAFVRHGQTPDNCEAGQKYTMPDGSEHVSDGKKLSGWNNVRLTAQGWQQARTAGQEMASDFGVERLAKATYLCSPQPRVQDTFKGFLEGAGLDGQPLDKLDDVGFRERSAGKLTSLKWAEAGEQWSEMKLGKQARVFHVADFQYPEGIAEDGQFYAGESLVDVANRAAPALDGHITKADGKDVFVFAHELTIKAMLPHVEFGCTDHLANPCTTDQTFKQVVPNAKPLIFVRVGNGWVRSDSGDQRRPGGTQASEPSRMAA